MDPEARAGLIARHVAALRERTDAGAYLQTLTPEAYVIVGGQACKRRDVGAPELAAYWVGIPPGHSPRFGDPEAIVEASGEKTRRIVAATLPEASTGRALRAAFGLEAHGAQWLVAWAGLWEGEILPYPLQRMAACAELASLDPLAPFGPFLSLLDVGFARTARLPAEPLQYLPETRFSCHGTGHCCSQGLTIPLEPHAARFVAETPWQELAPGVGPGPYVWEVPDEDKDNLGFGHLLSYREDGTCHLLRDDRRCAVHALLGRAVLTPCHVFPYQFAWSPDGICVSVHHMCPSVQERRGTEPSAKEQDVRSRLAVAGGVRADAFRLTLSREIAWEAFRDAEARLLDILAGPEPLREKLWMALDWLNTWDTGRPEPTAPNIPAVDRDGWAILETLAAAFDRYFYRVEGLPAGDTTLAGMEPLLARWFRSLVWGKTFTYAHGLIGGFNDLALIYRIMARQLRRWESGGVPGVFWSNLFALVTPARGAFQKQVDTMYRENDGTYARQAESPLLGQNLLRGFC